jgi:hypothetical protein
MLLMYRYMYFSFCPVGEFVVFQRSQSSFSIKFGLDDLMGSLLPVDSAREKCHII